MGKKLNEKEQHKENRQDLNPTRSMYQEESESRIEIGEETTREAQGILYLSNPNNKPSNEE